MLITPHTKYTTLSSIYSTFLPTFYLLSAIYSGFLLFFSRLQGRVGRSALSARREPIRFMSSDLCQSVIVFAYSIDKNQPDVSQAKQFLFVCMFHEGLCCTVEMAIMHSVRRAQN